VDTTIGTGGGTISYTKAGDPLNGFQLTMPAGALAGPTTIVVSHGSSAGLPLGADLVSSEPLIMLTSDGPAMTSADFTLRIPTSIPIGVTTVVLVVDSTRSVLGVLNVVSRDSTSVTVLSRVLDNSAVQGPSGGSVFGRVVPWSRRSPRLPMPFATQLMRTPSSQTWVVVTGAAAGAAGSLGQVLPRDLSWGFVAGRDDWEFHSLRTTYSPSTDLGQVFSEWWLFALKQAGGGGQLWGVGQNAAGLDYSNPDGIMLSAGLSADFSSVVGASVANQVVFAHGNPSLYHRHVAMALYQEMAHFKTVEPLILSNSTFAYKMVLVTGWSAAGQYFTVVDPAAPGQVQHLDFSTGVMAPYVEPGKPSLVWDVPVFANQLLWCTVFLQLGPQFTELGNQSPDSPYGHVWPVWIWISWDPEVDATAKGVADTLFMVRDTTRIFVMAHTPFGAPTGPPGLNLQTQIVYLPDATGTWVPDVNSGDGTYFIDYTHFAKPSGSPWVNFQLGLVAESYTASDLSSVAWLGWRAIDVVKFGFAVPPVPASPGVPVTLSIVSLGGPPLPPDAKYRWDFNDGTPPVTVSASLSVTHTYQNAGSFTAGVEMLHGKTGAVIGQTSSSANVAGHFAITPAPLAANPGVVTTLTAVANGVASAGLTYTWNFGDGTPSVAVTDVTTVQHMWTNVNTYPVTLNVSLTSGGVPVAPQVTSTACVGTAWRLTSFTQSAFTTPGSGTPSDYLGALNQLYGYLDQVNATPSDGLLYLGDGTFFVNQGVYFQVAPPGTGAAGACWLRAGYTAQVAWLGATNSSYGNSGTLDAGSITGTAFGYLPFAIPTGPGSALQFTNSVNAVKTGMTLTGTVKFGSASYSGGRTYTFTATRLAP
jgi:hypothetical protein